MCVQLSVVFHYPFDICTVYSDIPCFILMLVICVFSYFFIVRLARGLPIVLNFSKNPIFVLLIFSIFFFVFGFIDLHPSLFPFSACFEFILSSLSRFLRWEYWFETFPLFQRMHFSAINFPASAALTVSPKFSYVVFSFLLSLSYFAISHEISSLSQGLFFYYVFSV